MEPIASRSASKGSKTRHALKRILAYVLTLTLAATCSLSAAQVAHAGTGGLGASCSLNTVSVSVESNSDILLYVYTVVCPGPPLGIDLGVGFTPATYQEIGTWDPQTSTAYDNLFNFDRSESQLGTWNCTDDPWTTPAQDANDNIPGGHTCVLQSQRGGSDWTDTNGTSFGSDMCFNDPWGVSLAGCWGNDDLSVTGPSASVLHAWQAGVLQASGHGGSLQSAPAPGQPVIPFPVHEPLPIHGVINSSSPPSPTPVATPKPLPIHVPGHTPVPHTGQRMERLPHGTAESRARPVR